MRRGERLRGDRAPPFDRSANLERLRTETPFDVVVIGGGITGAGVALDAASRGLSTALIERDDFASGTSSRSSRLVHGGLRYLQQGDLRLVYEALHERQRLVRNAPHLVSVLPFMIPILARDGLVPKKIARALGTAMWMYDLTGGIRLGKVHKRLSSEDARAHMPTLPHDRLSSAYLYYDATADDARLTLTVARTAAAHGAVVVNRCEVTGFLADGGVSVTDRLAPGDDTPASSTNGDNASRTPSRFDIPARVIVNATGVWADDVRALRSRAPNATIRPAKGVHITVPWELVRNDVAVVIRAPSDQRNLFVVPWDERADGTFDHCYIGTTDTEYDGPLDDPQCTADDIAYVLRALNAALDRGDHEPITGDDVTATWAGLRPLVASATSGRTADLSRRHDVTMDDDVITVTGGKLTTYRGMAEDTVDAVAARLAVPARCRTKRLRLLGAPHRRVGALASGFAGLPVAAIRWLWRRGAGRRHPPATDHQREQAPASGLATRLTGRYGSLAADVAALVDADPSLREPLVRGLPYLRAEAVYAVYNEMAISLVDVLTRRTRAHLIDRAATRRAAPDIARVLAPHARWDDAEIVAQVAEYDALCRHEMAASHHDVATS